MINKTERDTFTVQHKSVIAQYQVKIPLHNKHEMQKKDLILTSQINQTLPQTPLKVLSSRSPHRLELISHTQWATHIGHQLVERMRKDQVP